MIRPRDRSTEVARRARAPRVAVLAAGWLPFALVGTLLWSGTRALAPRLELAGLGRPLAFSLGLYAPFALLGALALLLAWREAGARGVAARLRLRAPSARGWALTGVVLVVVVALEAALAPTARHLAQLPGFGVPATFPAPFDPSAPLAIPPESYLGAPLAGAPWLALLALAGLLANILGEELFWRGWLLPRHESSVGGWAWLPHGLGWLLLVHAFMPWAWLALLPTTLLVPWLAQRTGSTWPAIVVHGAGNAVYALLVVVAVLP